MERLWAPWRKEYMDKLDREQGCIFCIKPAEKDDRKNHIIERRKYAYSMLNIYPYNNGHLMVAPYRHTGYLDDLSQEELIEMIELVKSSCRKLKAAIKPEGFNLGVNLGKVAGAGFADHIHIHVVPRWEGDTNFMPVVARTKVIPQSLDDLYRLLV